MKKHSIRNTIKIPIQYAPRRCALYALLVLFDAAVVTLKIQVTAHFIDSIHLFLTNQLDLSSLYVPSTAFFAVLIYEWFSPLIIQIFGARLKVEITKGVRVSIVDTRAKLEYHHIENEKTNDMINNVSDNPENRIYGAFNIMVNSVGLLIKISGIIFMLFTQIWWAALLVILISVPMMTLAMKSGKQNYQVYSELSKARRMTDYLKDLLTTRNYINEKTIFQYSSQINDEWNKQYKDCLSKEMRVKRQWYVKSKARGMIATLVTMIIIGILVYALSKQAITIGFFVSIISSAMGLISSLTWQLPHYLQELSNFNEYAKDYFSLQNLGTEEAVLCPPASQKIVFHSLEFVDVSFLYPNTNKVVLNHVSFKLESGKHYAIVGVNGAGKSTIIKLIAGLYRDYSGTILLNDKDIHSFGYDEIKSLVSIVFQDFAKYAISLKDNILLGDINHYTENEKQVKLTSIIHDAGLDKLCSSLERGWDTDLGKIRENSVDLSGGEWQRIAIARGEIREAPLSIMDEPTAALDPLSESEQYQKYSEISRGKTVLFISHRLGSIMMADEIILLDGGGIQSMGTHSHLMRTSQLYTDLYEKQRGLYK